MIKYNLSITTGGLFVLETVTLLKTYKETESWDGVWKKVEDENLLQKTHLRSARNIYIDVKKRLGTAYPWEIETIMHSEDPEDWGFICMAFTARRYHILKDVLVDIINYKWQGGDLVLESFEIPEYVNALSLDHPELDKLSVRTREDLMQILKRDIRDGGLLEKHTGRTFRIKLPRIGDSLRNLYIQEGSIDDLRFLLFSEYEIKKIKGDLT